MTTAVEADTTKAALAETDNLTSQEARLKEIQIDVVSTPDGALPTFQLEDEKVPLTPLALKELATILNIPATFLMRCSADLQSRILSHFQSELTDRKKIRCVVGADRVQGVTSPNFIPLLNVPLFDTLVGAVGAGNPDEATIMFVQHGWGATRIGLANTMLHSHGVDNPSWKSEDEPMDMVYLGIDFINSLTATTHTELRPAVFRVMDDLVMVTPIPRSGAPHYRFDRKSNMEISEWIPSAIGDIQSQHTDIENSLDAVAKHDVGDTAVALEAELENLPGTLREAVQPAFEKEPVATLWGIINAISRAAKDADDEVPEGHRYQAQKFAGKLALNAICDECKRPVLEHG